MYKDNNTKTRVETYPEYAQQPVKAIKLWNDWNLQVNALASRTPSGLEYLAIREEDVFAPEKQAEILQKLSRFVGSSMDEQAICCLAKQTFEGRRLSRPAALRPQYGKRRRALVKVQKPDRTWRNEFQGSEEKANLLRFLQTEASVALEKFGYNPEMDIDYIQEQHHIKCAEIKC